MIPPEAEKKQRGAWSVETALALADHFSEDCWKGKEIPGWALALRALASQARLHRKIIEWGRKGGKLDWRGRSKRS